MYPDLSRAQFGGDLGEILALGACIGLREKWESPKKKKNFFFFLNFHLVSTP